MTHSEIRVIDAQYSLALDCGRLPSDPAVIAAGHEPNGSFWDGVVTLPAPELVSDVELDSEGGMFCAYGPQDVLGRLQAVLEPVASTPDAVAQVFARAEAEGFQFDD
jgi:hypothetical protein